MRGRRAIGAWLSALLLSTACDESPQPSQTLHMLRSSLDKAAGGVVVEFDLSRGVSEKAPSFSLLSGAGAPTYADLVMTLLRASKDRRTHGFLLRLGESDLSWAQTEELGRLLGGLKPEQPVVCHAHAYSNATLLFALSACDRVWLSPAGEVASVGIAGQMLYLKRLLERFKVKADFLHMGRYKSAAETLTEDGPTEAARESLDAVLGSLRQTWIDSLSASRAGVAMHEAGREIQKFAEYGPWAPEAAVQAGLVDAVGYLSEARDDAKARAAVDEVETSFGLQARRDAGDELAQLLRFIAGTSQSDHSGAQVAVLPTAGGIGMSGGGVVGGDGIAADSLTKTLRRLRDNDSVKAVVLRIDSPGGSALASDLLWHELMLLREKKPLIASLAGTAASGGYYMACAATRILAERTSIIGSIGVVGGKIVFGEALNDFGVSGVTFPANKEPGAAARAAYLSPLTTWDDPTRESVRAQMASIYELFLRRVSQGRDLPIDEVRKIAEGRIWSGAQGLEIKLIDGFGGLSEAIALAKQQAGLEDNAEVKIEGGSEGMLEMLGIQPDSDESSIRAALARVRAAAPGPFDSLTEPLRPYGTSLLPLLGRERVLAAVPFALQIR